MIQNRYSGQISYNPVNLIKIYIINNLSSKSTCKESFRIGLFNVRSIGTDKAIDILFLTWLRPFDDEIKCNDLTPSDYTINSFVRNSRDGGIASNYMHK